MKERDTVPSRVSKTKLNLIMLAWVVDKLTQWGKTTLVLYVQWWLTSGQEECVTLQTVGSNKSDGEFLSKLTKFDHNSLSSTFGSRLLYIGSSESKVGVQSIRLLGRMSRKLFLDKGEPDTSCHEMHEQVSGKCHFPRSLSLLFAF